jgi:hypothetical protein
MNIEIGYQILKGNGQWSRTFYAPAEHVSRMRKYPWFRAISATQS